MYCILLLPSSNYLNDWIAGDLSKALVATSADRSSIKAHDDMKGHPCNEPLDFLKAP